MEVHNDTFEWKGVDSGSYILGSANSTDKGMTWEHLRLMQSKEFIKTKHGRQVGGLKGEVSGLREDMKNRIDHLESVMEDFEKFIVKEKPLPKKLFWYISKVNLEYEDIIS